MMTDTPDETSDWIDFNTTLTRKTSETLSKWVTKNAEKKITDRELYIVVGALWDSVSGLVNPELLRTLEAVHGELRTILKGGR